MRRHLTTLTAGVILGAVVAGGIAYAAIPDSTTKQITACILKAGANKGATRIIDAQHGATCKTTETKIAWAATGANWRGTWSGGRTYRTNDIAYHQGTSYRARRTNTGITPGTSSADWVYLARAGATGPQGPPGADGADATYQRPGNLTSVPSSGGAMVVATIGVDGLAVFAHGDNDGLRVTHCENVACSASTTTTVDDGGSHLGITIGVDGHPVISQRNDTTSALRLVHCANVACTAATAADADTSGTGHYSSITIGTDGNPIISHIDQATDGLRVTHCNDPDCTSANSQIVDDPGNDSRNTSIAIGADGLPVIVYTDRQHDNLRLVHCDDITCGLATPTAVDEAGDFTGTLPRVVIGADGLPLIASTNFTDFTLRLVHCDDAECAAATPTTVTVAGHDSGFYASAAIGPDGLPLIAHVDTTDQAVLVTRCTDVTCTTHRTVSAFEPGHSVQYFIAAVFGADGLPLLGSMNFDSGGLWVTHCSNRWCVPNHRP